MSKTPIVRPVSWLNAAVNICVLIMFIFIGFYFGDFEGAAIGCAAYLLLSLYLRRFFGNQHRIAISLIKKQEFQNAIPHFEKSYEYFSARPWLDKFRAITMLSSAAMCYREMALVSTAFCYGQLGNAPKAREYYERCLSEFPENALATTALKFMDACESPQTD